MLIGRLIVFTDRIMPKAISFQDRGNRHWRFQNARFGPCIGRPGADIVRLLGSVLRSHLEGGSRRVLLVGLVLSWLHDDSGTACLLIVDIHNGIFFL